MLASLSNKRQRTRDETTHLPLVCACQQIQPGRSKPQEGYQSIPYSFRFGNNWPHIGPLRQLCRVPPSQPLMSLCTPYTVHFTLYTVHCTLYTVHCTLYIVHCTTYTVHFTENFLFNNVFCSLYIFHALHHSIKCTQYTTHSAPCTTSYNNLHYILQTE